MDMNHTEAFRKDFYRSRGRKPEHCRRYKMLLAAAAAVIISILLFGITVRSVQAREPEDSRVKYYTSIQIRRGDTLWEIADKIADTYGLDTRDCVEELKFMNNMKTDTIHTGNYLTVFYYSGQEQ